MSGFCVVLFILASWCLVDTSITALAILGTNDTSVSESLNAKHEEPTARNLFFKKLKGISILFDLIVPK